MEEKLALIINSIFDENTLLKRIAEIRRMYYPSLANKKDVTQTKNYVFFKGWLNKINDYLGG